MKTSAIAQKHRCCQRDIKIKYFKPHVNTTRHVRELLRRLVCQSSQRSSIIRKLIPEYCQFALSLESFTTMQCLAVVQQQQIAFVPVLVIAIFFIHDDVIEQVEYLLKRSSDTPGMRINQLGFHYGVTEANIQIFLPSTVIKPAIGCHSSAACSSDPQVALDAALTQKIENIFGHF